MPDTLFLAQLATCLFMTGLIWFVQIVHYPLFAHVGKGQIQTYEPLHARRTTWVVFPPMLIELLTSLAMLYPPLCPAFLPAVAAWALASMVIVIWATTGLVQVPQHTRLGQPLEPDVERETLGLLVTLNWIRTVAWTMRAALLLYLVSFPLRHALS